MTEFWKSNPMHFCDICKVWMQDTKAARQNHERGFKHTELLAKKIRDMGKNEEAKRKAQSQAEKDMADLEEAAKKQFEKDQEAAEQLRGTWKKQEDTGYYYNEEHRWYYDPKTQWYYGGEPTPEWTQRPELPEVALFDYFKKKQQAAKAKDTASTSQPSSSGQTRLLIKKASEAASMPGAPKHPMSDIGGYQMPTDGRIGGAKGVGRVDSNKRKRDEFAGLGPGSRGKKVNPKEEEELKKREAARARVAARTKSAFGLT